MDKKAITSEDVAKMAGVSQSTVSRVFGGNTNVSEKKKKRVLEAAAKLNYQLNAYARSLITNKTKIIGIVIRDIHNPFYSATLDMFYTRLANLGYHIIFISTKNEEIQEEEIWQFLEYKVAGVIITDSVLSSSAAQRFERSSIVVVLFNRYTNPLETSAVYCDNYLAAKQMAYFLIEMGHKSFALISGPSNTSTSQDRLRGFREVLDERNIKKLIVAEGDYSYESGFKNAQELTVTHKEVDCIFCGNDIIALGVMDAIRMIGLKIPENLSVIGFDNIGMAAWPSYALTTWEQPLAEMIDSTIDILLEEIEDNEREHRIVLLKGHLVIRSSVRVLH